MTDDGYGGWWDVLRRITTAAILATFLCQRMNLPWRYGMLRRVLMYGCRTSVRSRFLDLEDLDFLPRFRDRHRLLVPLGFG